MSRTFLITACLLVLAGTVAAPARQERPRAAWEYKVMDEVEIVFFPANPDAEDAKARFLKEMRAREPDERRKLLTAGFNALGEQGWELAGVTAVAEPVPSRRTLYHFKRAK